MQQEDPQVTLQKFSKMGVLLLLDSPEHLQFGIDNISWKVGSKFKGIKLIPLGTHIITYSLKSENYMFPIKKFIYFGPTSNETKDDERIRVFKWSSKVQRFVALKGEEAEGYREGVKKYHFDCYLGPYPQQNVQFWNSNTNHISKQVLEKLDPIEYYEDYAEQYNTNTQKLKDNLDANIDSGSDEQELADVAKEVEDLQMQESELQEQKIKQNKSKEQNIQEVKKNKDFGGNIFYSDIPRRLTDSKDHTTQINMDRSAVLSAVIKSNWINNQFGILGELQYSFISFLIGQCLDSYDQWKKLIIMLSNSQKAFDTHKPLMLEFIAVLYEQLRQFPQDFFIDELAKDNFLGTCLAKLKIYSIEKAINKKSVGRIEKLLSLVNEKFGYQPVEEEDQSPIVVDQHESYF